MGYEPQSFEVQGTRYSQTEDRISTIKQIVEDAISSNPAHNWVVRFGGEAGLRTDGVVNSDNFNMSLTYHCYEMDLPNRIKQIDEQAEDAFKSFEKYLKSEFKSVVGKTLKMKEDKEARSHSVEKVSLNNRYYYRSTRTYAI